MQPDAKRPRLDADSGPPKTGGRKRKALTPEVEIRLAIQMAARKGNISEALEAYDRAKADKIKVTIDSFASILYLCSGGDEWEDILREQPKLRYAGARGKSDDAPNNNNAERRSNFVAKDPGSHHAVLSIAPEVLNRGEAILEDMISSGTKPNEICYTALARMAALKGDPAEALNLAKRVAAEGLSPRLRCFTPALAAYAEMGDGEGAFVVDKAIAEAGLEPGEAELSRLLEGASGAGASWDQAEEVLRRMSRDLTALTPVTLQRVETFFKSSAALKGLPAGMSWTTGTCTVAADGTCEEAGGNLAAIDLGPSEYEEFKRGVADLAARQERHPNDFQSFLQWLQEHGPFDIVVDAANVAFYGQNFESGGFNFSQIAAVIDTLRADHPGMKPLVILHVARTRSPAAQEPAAQELLEKLRKEGSFFATPQGSNDDWYWLYAAIASGPNGLLVSNDEMRDHVFHLLAPKYCGKWKQRHQLRYRFAGSPTALSFEYPAPYTECVQCLDSGAWVFPGLDGKCLYACPQPRNFDLSK